MQVFRIAHCSELVVGRTDHQRRLDVRNGVLIEPASQGTGRKEVDGAAVNRLRRATSAGTWARRRSIRLVVDVGDDQQCAMLVQRAT